MSESENKRVFSAGQLIFKNAPEEYKKLIRDVLKDEREVMHLRRRRDLHSKIYEHVRRIIR